MGKGRLEYHGAVWAAGHIHADDVRAVHKRHVTISQRLDFNRWRHEYQPLLIVLPCKAALGIGKQPFVSGLWVGDGELVEQLEERDIPGWSAANQHRRPLATLQDLEPIFDTFSDWMGSVSDPVRSIMDALGCSYNHAIGVVRGLKVPAKRLLIALRIRENRRTLGTPPKAVLMARGGFLRKIVAEMLAELEDAGRGDSEPARAYREAVSTWDRVGDKLEPDRPWR